MCVKALVKRKFQKSTNYAPDKRKALTAEQQAAFFKILEEPEHAKWKNLFTVMFGTGLRVGEFTALCWEDCDFENKVIHISHSLSYRPIVEKDFKCEYHIGDPKTKAGLRMIPMLDKVYQALLDEKEYQTSTGISCVNEIDGLSGFIFFNKFGNVHNQSSINAVIKRLILQYNMDEELKAKKERRTPVLIPSFSCHIIRHTI